MAYSDETPDFFRDLLLSLGFVKQSVMALDVSTHYKHLKTGMSIYLDEDIKILPSGYMKQHIGRMMRDHGFEYGDIQKEMERIKQERE